MSMRKILLMSVLLCWSGAAYAQDGRQIRLDKDTCRNIMPEYLRKKGNSLYAMALTAQKAGKANEMQKRRIREVEFLKYTVKAAKCKGA